MSEEPRTRTASSLSLGFRPVRALFDERSVGSITYWYCRLCPYSYYEYVSGAGWPLSVEGLFLLVKHLRGHQHS